MEQYNELKSAIDSILSTDSVIKRRKRSESDKKMELFKQVIFGLEEIYARSFIASYELGMELGNYDEKFMEIIDALIYTNYGKECYSLISFYLYERINPEDGSINPITIEDTGEKVYLNDPYELYNMMKRLNPKID